MESTKDILQDALTFHGHKCWASTAGVRIGLAALEALAVERSGAKSLHAIVLLFVGGRLLWGLL